MSQQRRCPVCTHPERSVVERALALGQAPRSIRRRYSDLTRRAIQKHRDECLKDAVVEEARLSYGT